MSTPVEPRDSATVVLVRPAAPHDAPWVPAGGATPYEIFMVRRHAASRFAPDVYVFPGGTLQANDWPPADLPPADAPTADLSAADADARLGGPERAGLDTAAASLALWINALRELFEEAGVLLARDAAGDWVRFAEPAAAERFAEPAAAERFAAHRAAITSNALSLWALAQRERLTLAPGALRYWAHWITPAAAPQRFDTRFFLALLPPGQEALHCGAQVVPEALAATLETTDGVWIAPGDALAGYAAGTFPLVFATHAHLERLATFATLEALWAHTENKPVVTVLPRGDWTMKPPQITIPPEVADCW